MSAKPQVSAQNFFRRVKSLYTHWKDVIDLFSIFLFSRLKRSFPTLMPSASKMVKMKNLWKSRPLLSSKFCPKSNFINFFSSSVWLFGYEFLDSWLFFTKNGVIFLASQKHSKYQRLPARILTNPSFLYWTFQRWKRRLQFKSWSHCQGWHR